MTVKKNKCVHEKQCQSRKYLIYLTDNVLINQFLHIILLGNINFLRKQQTQNNLRLLMD